MFYDNISYLVGSANAKLASDIKRIQKETRCKSSRFPSYLFCNSLRQSSSNDSKDFNLDFEIVKISCKKEADNENPNRKYLVKNIFFKNQKLEFAVKLLIFLIIGSIVSFAVYRIVNIRSNSKNLVEQNGAEIETNKNMRYYKRAANIFSMNDTIEWSGEKIPMCYQIEPLTFFDSNNDGFGDLKGIITKLDYFKNVLFVNCLLIKNLQNYYDLNSEQFLLNQSESIDPKIGKLDDLHQLVDLAHKNQIRVILEIDITGTSIYHKLFTSHLLKDIYLVKNSTYRNNKWVSNIDNFTSYFSNGLKDFAYFDYDNLIAQETIIDIFKFWFNFNSDGFYLKNFNQIQYKNTSSIQNLIDRIQKITVSASIPVFTLIGNYSTDDFLLNKILNIYHVELDALKFKNDIEKNLTESIEIIENYLNLDEKKLIWSLKNLPQNDNEFKHELLKEFYFLIYSLPGITLIKQGDELENDSTDQLEIFYWNNQEANHGFGNNTKFSKFPILKMDLKSNLNKLDSLVNFIKLFNTRVKTKLNDIKPIKKFTTHLPAKPKAPPPFRNSFDSMGQDYLISNYYNISNWKSVLKITRQIHNRKIENSFKFYRNVLFLFNFSQLNISIDYLVSFVQNKYNLRSTIHVIYDSTSSLPEYIRLDSQNLIGFQHRLSSKHFLALEF